MSPLFNQVEVGDKLPRRAIGPHSIASFSSEWRAWPFNIWGALEWVGVPGMDNAWIDDDPGWLHPIDYDEARIDPRSIDGLYAGRRPVMQTRRQARR